MGGHLLLRTLVERRPALDAAVLVAPMIGVNSAPVPAWLAPTFADTMCRLGYSAQPMWKTPRLLSRPGSQRQHFLTGSRARYEDELFWWKQEPGFNLGAPSWGWLRAAFRSAAAAFTPERLAAVELPILILGTERDRLVSPAAIRRVARLLPRAELHMFPPPRTSSCARPTRSAARRSPGSTPSSPGMPDDRDILIVGAGMAGASLAAELAGMRAVMILEAESQPGYHATGRSAAFWSESYGGPLIRPLTSASGPSRCSPASDAFPQPQGRDPPRRRARESRRSRRWPGSFPACSSRWAGPRSRPRYRG